MKPGQGGSANFIGSFLLLQLKPFFAKTGIHHLVKRQKAWKVLHAFSHSDTLSLINLVKSVSFILSSSATEKMFEIFEQNANMDFEPIFKKVYISELFKKCRYQCYFQKKYKF